MNLLVALGLQKHNIVVCDSKGVIYQGREPNMAETKAAYAVVDDGKRTLDDVIEGADIFLGCSGPKVLTRGNGEENGSCANDPGAGEPGTGNSAAAGEKSASGCHHLHLVVLTIQTRSTTSFASRFIFRGALDVGATAINEEMKLAAVRAIAELAHAEQSEVVGFSVWRSGSELWSGIHHSKTV